MFVTVDEVEKAASVLERVSEIYGLQPQFGEWSAADLRAELPYLRELEVQQRELEVIAKKVENAVFTGLDVVDAVKKVLSDYEVRSNE